MVDRRILAAGGGGGRREPTGPDEPADPGGRRGRSQPDRITAADEAELDRLLVESVTDYAIFRLDPTGHIKTWNAGAERIKGYSASEIIGRDFSVFYTPEDRANGVPAHALEIASRAGHFEMEGWRVRKDGSRFWADVVITALRDNRGELVGFAKITRDLTERRRGEEAIQRADSEIAARRAAEGLRKTAEAATRSRDEILAIVAHDLRNPLHTMLMSAALIDDVPLSGDELRRQLAVIRRSGERMERLVRDLLDLSQIESGRLSIVRRWVDPDSIAHEACASLNALASNQGHEVACDVQGGLPRVCADRDRVVQALSNYIANAVKFSPPDARITIAASTDQEGVVFRVSDSGPGIAADELSHVFDRFWRAKRTAHLGAGLGLAITKGIAESHGGRVWAESELGRGSSFYLLLPHTETCPEHS